MVAPLNWKLLLVGIIVAVYVSRRSGGESSTCLTVYKEGGAPAVFQSPKCPHWTLPNLDAGRGDASSRCQSAMRQGRRKSQEDRTLCALDIQIPFPMGGAGKIGIKEVIIGVVAVFDGHNGAEASDMASRLLLDYFALHTYFLLDSAYSYVFKKINGGLSTEAEKNVIFQVRNKNEQLGRHELSFDRLKFSFPENFDDSFHLEIMKEALLRSIHDIDLTFSKEATRNNLDSGSTATIVLIANGQILVANIGDSKAFMCSEKFQSPAEAKATLLRLYMKQRHDGAVSRGRGHNIAELTTNGLKHYIVKELTKDHHPDRDDEKFRVETAGGYVIEWGGVSRVNGQLAVSRAIGDVHFKSHGVISAPEVTDWQPLVANDSYLVVGSDGVFENMSLQDVCDLLWEVESHGTDGLGISSSCPYSLSECLVNAAIEKGSTDNVASVVVPLGFPQKVPRDNRLPDGSMYCSTRGLKKLVYEQSANGISSDLVQLEHGHPLIAKFDRLLVEGKHGNFGCYYLSENLNDNADMLQDQENDWEDYKYDLPRPLPGAFDHLYGGPINVYNDQNLCLNVGMPVDGVKDQCISPEGFASFVGLLESIPLDDAGTYYGSTEYVMPDLRYVLKKRFGRGSYGEVWLAFYWNCHQDSNGSSWSGKNQNVSFDASCFSSNMTNSSYSTSHDRRTGSPDDNLFILKRIMVERGAAFYLSGLREKYFGELFLNASRCLGGLPSVELATLLLEELQSDFDDPIETNETVHGSENSWSFENIFLDRFRFQRQKAAFEVGLNHIARYVESFESRSSQIWLVFRYEGISLTKLMYTVEEVQNNNADEDQAEEVKHSQVLHPSKWWHWLKTTEAGQEEMRNLIWQLVCLLQHPSLISADNFSVVAFLGDLDLVALKSCHDRNITHRDIKPENMVLCFEDQDNGRCLKGVPTGDKNYSTKMRIIDFGSAIDEFTMKHLYGLTGPSRAEQTYEYTPPEAFLNASWHLGSPSIKSKYDMWSVGVVMLELILGSPNVFQISALTRALLDPHIEGWNEDLKELACKLRSLMELCILIPGGSSKRHRTMGQGGASPASWKCSEEFFSHQIKNRDPLKLGFPNVWALRLVRQLLLWDPVDRLSVDDALQHPYFQPPPRG